MLDALLVALDALLVALDALVVALDALLVALQTFREVEGAVCLNTAGPLRIKNCKMFTFELEVPVDLSATPHTSGVCVHMCLRAWVFAWWCRRW